MVQYQRIILFPDSYVYSYGHRNPQGIAWNSDGTIMYNSEHGEHEA
ncbi:PQQ-dependent sugar dehydrogenase [Neobacillus sp. SuZ13]|nr:PQQ-dependent sugar dehydrogenase [Neobacillus sp. SuZ13]WHY68889.1 PQQ-dependent sugar dehydrogenase [Neobacillus sp. SuZ13]